MVAALSALVLAVSLGAVVGKVAAPDSADAYYVYHCQYPYISGPWAEHNWNTTQTGGTNDGAIASSCASHGPINWVPGGTPQWQGDYLELYMKITAFNYQSYGSVFSRPLEANTGFSHTIWHYRYGAYWQGSGMSRSATVPYKVNGDVATNTHNLVNLEAWWAYGTWYADGINYGCRGIYCYNGYQLRCESGWGCDPPDNMRPIMGAGSGFSAFDDYASPGASVNSASSTYDNYSWIWGGHTFVHTASDGPSGVANVQKTLGSFGTSTAGTEWWCGGGLHSDGNAGRQSPCLSVVDHGTFPLDVETYWGNGAGKTWGYYARDFHGNPTNGGNWIYAGFNVDAISPSVSFYGVNTLDNAGFVRPDQGWANYSSYDSLSGLTTESLQREVAANDWGSVVSTAGGTCQVGNSDCRIPAISSFADGTTLRYRACATDNSYNQSGTANVGCSAPVSTIKDGTAPAATLDSLLAPKAAGYGDTYSSSKNWIRGTVTPAASSNDSVSGGRDGNLWSSTNGSAPSKLSGCSTSVAKTTCSALNTTSLTDGTSVEHKARMQDRAGNGSATGDITSNGGTGLTGRYAMDDTNPSTTLADASGNTGRDGQIMRRTWEPGASISDPVSGTVQLQGMVQNIQAVTQGSAGEPARVTQLPDSQMPEKSQVLHTMGYMGGYHAGRADVYHAGAGPTNRGIEVVGGMGGYYGAAGGWETLAGKEIIPAAKQSSVTALPLRSPWVNYPGTFYQGGGYMKDADGMVHMQGLIQASTAFSVAGGTNQIATLPAGFRPAQTVMLNATAYDAAYGYATARVQVNPDGAVAWVASNRAFSGYSGSWVSLSGLKFAVSGSPMKANALNLAQGFAHYTSFETPTYGKDSEGNVYLSGTIRASSTWNPALPIARLPRGYRPRHLTMLSGLAASANGSYHADSRLEVHPNGDVYFNYLMDAAGVAPNFGASSWTSLDGVSFRVAQRETARTSFDFGGGNWRDYDGTPDFLRRGENDNIYGKVGSFVDSDGTAHLAGVAKKSSNLAYDDTVFNVAEGARPAKQQIFSVLGGDNGMLRMDVNPAGRAYLLGSMGVTGYGSNASARYVSADDIHYLTKGSAARSGLAPATLTSPWTNYDPTTATSTYESASYAKNDQNIVSLQGIVRNTAAFAFSGTNLTIMTLPVGYRPSKYVNADVWAYDPTYGNRTVRIEIGTDGQVKIVASTGALGGAAGTLVSLAGIQFPATGSTVDSNWQPISMTSWTGPNAGNAPYYRVPSVTKDTRGNVYLSGMAMSSVVYYGGQEMGKLPIGYRPKEVVSMGAISFDSGSYHSVCRVNAYPSGSLQVESCQNNAQGHSGPAGAWIMLDTLQFRADNANPATRTRVPSFGAGYEDYEARRQLEATGALSGVSVNGAVKFPAGEQRYVEVSEKVGTDATSAFTYSGWVNWDGNGPNQRIFSLGSSALNELLLSPAVGTTSGPARLMVRQGGSDTLNIAAPRLPSGGWVHVAVTLNGSTARIYYNGTQVASAGTSFLPSALASSDFSAYLGAANQTNITGGGEFFAGRMDETQFYNRALTNAEVNDTYQAGRDPSAQDTKTWRVDNTNPNDDSGYGGNLVTNPDLTSWNDRAAAELSPNSTFDANTTGWSSSGTGTMSRDTTTWAYNGAGSLRLAGTNSTATTTGLVQTSAQAAAPGRTYTARLVYKDHVGGTHNGNVTGGARLVFYNSADSPIASPQPQANITGAARSPDGLAMSVAAVAPTGAASVRLQAFGQNVPASGVATRFDFGIDDATLSVAGDSFPVGWSMYSSAADVGLRGSRIGAGPTNDPDGNQAIRIRRDGGPNSTGVSQTIALKPSTTYTVTARAAGVSGSSTTLRLRGTWLNNGVSDSATQTFTMPVDGVSRNYTTTFTTPAGVSATGNYFIQLDPGTLSNENEHAFDVDSLRIVPQDTGSAWRTNDQEVGITGSDATSGLQYMEYRLDNGTITRTASRDDKLTVSGNGAHTVESRAVDNAGNESAWKTTSVNIDTLAPTDNTAVDSGNWSSTAKTVSVVCNDPTPGSGLTATSARWRLNGGTEMSGANNSNVNVATEGVTTVETRCVDAVGNTSSWKSQTIRVDLTDPVDTTVAPSSAWTQNDVTVTASGTDTPSGIARMEWRVNGGAVTNVANNSTFTITTQGVVTVETRAVDNSGRTSAWKPFTVRIDKGDPTASAADPSPTSNYLRQRSFIPRATGTDAVSGPATVKVQEQVGGGAWTDLPGCVTTTVNTTTSTATCTARSLTAIADGTAYRLRGVTTDAAGRTANQTPEVLNTIDRTNPVDTVNDPTPGNAWVRGSYTPSGSVADATSGNFTAFMQERIGTGAYTDLPGCSLSGSAVSCSSHNTTAHSDGNVEELRLRSSDNARNSAYSTAVLADDPSGYWGFDENSGASTAADDGAGANPGTIAGGVQTQQTGAPATGNRRAYVFNGSTGSVNVPNDATLNSSPNLSVEAWANPTNTTAALRVLVAKENQYILRQNGTQLQGYIWSSGAWRQVLANNAFAAGEWHHYALTYDGTTLRLYRDGVQAATTAYTGTVTATTNPLTIGSYAGNQQYFIGAIDEAAFYNKTLTAARVLAHSDASSISVQNTVDNTPPNLGVTGSPGSAWQSANVTLTATATDATSGLANIQNRTNGGSVTTTATSPATITYSAEGVHNWEVWANDRAGNVTATQSGTVRIDKTPPTAGLSCPPAPAWSNTPVTCTISASDAGSGVDTVQYRVESTPGSGTFGSWQTSSPGGTFQVSQQGASAVELRVTDGSGRQSTANATVRVDSAGPDVTMSDPGQYLRGSVSLAATASDPLSGVANVRIEYRRSDAATGAPWTAACTDNNSPYNCTLNTTTIADGLYDFRAIATDNGGNATTSNTQVNRRVDNFSPVVGAVSGLTSGSFHSGQVTVTTTASDVNGTDPGSGVRIVAIEYSTNGGANWSTAPTNCDDMPNTSGSTYSCALSTTSLPDGTLTVRARAEDRAGNIGYGPQTTNVRIDNNAPNVALNAVPDYLRGTVALTAVATDAGSGVNFVRIERAPTGTNSWTTVCVDATADTDDAYTCNFDSTAFAQGTRFDFRAIAVDNRANSATSAQRNDKMVDNTAPTENVTGWTAGWVKNNVNLTFDADDGPGSGVQALEWKVGSGSWQSSTGRPQTITVTQDGATDVTTRVTDRAGNTSAEQTRTVRIDRGAPTATIGGVPAGWTRTPVNYTINGTDAVSGIASARWRVDQGSTTGTMLTGAAPGAGTLSSDGVYTIRGWVTDGAGNESAEATATARIDFTAPTDTTTVPSGWQSDTVNVNVTGTDAASGVANVEWRLNGGTVQSGPSGSTVAISAEGTTTLETRINDNAGNSSTWKSQTIRIDRSSPTLEVLSGTGQPYSGAAWRNTDAQVQLRATDQSALSRTLRIEWEYTDGSGFTDITAGQRVNTTNADPYSTTLDFTEQGKRTLRARAVDNAGRTSAWQSFEVNIDKTAPDVTMSVFASPSNRLEDQVSLNGSGADRMLRNAPTGSGVAGGFFEVCKGTDCATNPSNPGWEGIDQTSLTDVSDPKCSPTVVPTNGLYVCNFDTRRYENGTYYFRLAARDGAGNIGRSDPLPASRFRNGVTCPVSL